MKNVRIWFEKTGAARYISHLDLTHCMSRALRLSGLPVWYTEGFNPRVYMTYAMPLSLGVRGERECMDIRLTEETALEEIPRRLNEKLPADIRVWGATEPVHKFEETAFAEYEILLETENSAALEDTISRLFAMESVTVTKHSKKGDKELDIKPHFADMEVDRLNGNRLRVAVRLPCGVSGSVNPSLLLDALERHAGETPYGQIVRKRLLLKDFSEIA